MMFRVYSTVGAGAALALLLCSGTAMAQEQEVETSSGTTIDILNEILNVEPERIASNRSVLTADQTMYDKLIADEERMRTRQMDQRRTCREAIRKANKDSLLSVASQCLRSELLQEMNILNKELQYVDAMPLVDEDLRSLARSRIEILIDANSSVVDAVDADVFPTIESLVTAKRNLHAQYRIPMFLSRMRLRADRQLTWTFYIANTLKDWTQESGEDLTLEATCIQNVVINLRKILEATDIQTENALQREAKKNISSCRAVLRDAKPASEMSSDF